MSFRREKYERGNKKREKNVKEKVKRVKYCGSGSVRSGSSTGSDPKFSPPVLDSVRILP
jgi:hypothetical protein